MLALRTRLAPAAPQQITRDSIARNIGSEGRKPLRILVCAGVRRLLRWAVVHLYSTRPSDVDTFSHANKETMIDDASKRLDLLRDAARIQYRTEPAIEQIISAIADKGRVERIVTRRHATLD